jgi:hypothetical protein
MEVVVIMVESHARFFVCLNNIMHGQEDEKNHLEQFLARTSIDREMGHDLLWAPTFA